MTAEIQLIEDIKVRLNLLQPDPDKNNLVVIELRKQGKLPQWSLFEGYSEEKITGYESQLNSQLPLVFRLFLKELGERSGGLFCGSTLGGPQLLDEMTTRWRQWFEDNDEDAPCEPLPDDAVVFLDHQGYTCLYFRLSEGEIDAPIYQRGEDDVNPTKVAQGFAQLLLAEVELVENHRK